MTEDRCELRLVLTTQQEAGPDLHHPVRRHACVEMGRSHDIDADVGTVILGEPTNDLAHVVIHVGVTDQEARVLELPLGAVHEAPQPLLVALRCGPITRHQKFPPGSGGPRLRERPSREGEERAAAERTAKLASGRAHCIASETSAFTVSAAAVGVRRSPCDRTRRLNQTMSPDFRSTTEANPICVPPCRHTPRSAPTTIAATSPAVA